MKLIKFYFLLTIIVSIGLYSCSDIQDEITPPSKVTVHGSEVMMKTSANFHGKKLVDGNMESCKLCHASDYSGGTAKTSCVTCHTGINVHGAGYIDPNSPAFHGKFIAGKNWDMTQCSQCHGANYAGGVASPSCNTCHKQQGGPEACNTCHGDFANPQSIAPPRALNSSTSTDYAGVGAHQIHLNGIKIASNLACNECHQVPSALKSSGHIDNTPHAEIVFGSNATRNNSAAAYNYDNNKCSNTYCHGNFKFNKANSQYQFIYTEDAIVGNNYSPKWNKVDGTEGACGTCHGLPPKGHQVSDLRSCGTCHQGIVDSRGNIIDPVKHINGEVNVFGN
jgi:predicted CxxxxCH...CXXCH cytochrome family protein